MKVFTHVKHSYEFLQIFMSFLALCGVNVKGLSYGPSFIIAKSRAFFLVILIF